MAVPRVAKRKLNPKLGISPAGTLLEFVGDLSSEFGFAYERFLNFEKEPHAHDRFVFCAARGNCAFEVTEIKTRKVFRNSKDSSVFKAPHSLHLLRSDQTTYENLVFLPTVSRMRSVFDERGYDTSQWRLINTGIREVRRTPWFNALVERYFHKRVFAPQDGNSLKYLEDEILREILVMTLGEPSSISPKRTLGAISELPSPLKRAVEAIELSLFSKLKLEEICKTAGLSRASLMRTFRRELKLSPMAYARQRKLEEAKRLLAKGNHTVTEVSYLVGYEDTSAFCRAYKMHFGFSPKG